MNDPQNGASIYQLGRKANIKRIEKMWAGPNDRKSAAVADYPSPNKSESGSISHDFGAVFHMKLA